MSLNSVHWTGLQTGISSMITDKRVIVDYEKHMTPNFSRGRNDTRMRHALYMPSKRRGLAWIPPGPRAFLLFIKETTFTSSSLEKTGNSSTFPQFAFDRRVE